MKMKKQVKKGTKTYLRLFGIMFYLSAFTFGGGYVIVPLMKEKFVDELGWIEEEEMMNLVVIAQSAPGPIAVNTSLLVGYQIAGVAGALIAVLGSVTPPLIIITIVSIFYDAFRTNRIVNAVLKGMQAGVAAVVAHVVIGMGVPFVKNRQWLYVLIMAIAFVVSVSTNINVAFIILVGGVFGAFHALYKERAQEGEK